MPQENRRAVRSWYLYDWANSAFMTVITTVLLQAYFLTLFADKSKVELHIFGGTYTTSGISLWTYTAAFSMLLVVIVSPVLGAIADLSRGKKRFLGFCVFLGSIATAALSFVTDGNWVLCSALYIVANFLWSAGNIFYDGFLPELTRDLKRMDAISAVGYGIGYLGGGLALVVCAGLVFAHESLDLTEGEATRIAFLVVALWWTLFSIPILRHVPEKPAEGIGATEGGYVRAGFGRLAKTMRKVRQLPNLGRMLLAFLLYNAGIGTIMYVATAYGMDQLGLSLGTLIGVVLMVQLLGLPAAFLYIRIARKVGNKRAILIGLVVYVGVVVFAMQMTTSLEFWIMGVLVALVQGGTQAMSRSLYGSMIPQGMTAEFFGFFSVFNKVGPFFGPMLFGVVKDATGSSRMAILFLIVFFILGILVLLTVRGEKGFEEAEAFKAS